MTVKATIFKLAGWKLKVVSTKGRGQKYVPEDSNASLYLNIVKSRRFRLQCPLSN